MKTASRRKQVRNFSILYLFLFLKLVNGHRLIARGGETKNFSLTIRGTKLYSGDGESSAASTPPTGGGGAMPASAAAGMGGPRKKLQRVEILKIAEPCPLIDPSEVIVSKGELYVAEPIVTPIGQSSFLFSY